MPTTEGTADAWSADAEYYEYSKAANPIGSGLIPGVPLADFPASSTRRARRGSSRST